MPHGVSTLDNKPIIITFLAMEKVILLCTIRTHAVIKSLPRREKISAVFYNSHINRMLAVEIYFERKCRIEYPRQFGRFAVNHQR